MESSIKWFNVNLRVYKCCSLMKLSIYINKKYCFVIFCSVATTMRLVIMSRFHRDLAIHHSWNWPIFCLLSYVVFLYTRYIKNGMWNFSVLDKVILNKKMFQLLFVKHCLLYVYITNNNFSHNCFIEGTNYERLKCTKLNNWIFILKFYGNFGVYSTNTPNGIS